MVHQVFWEGLTRLLGVSEFAASPRPVASWVVASWHKASRDNASRVVGLGIAASWVVDRILPPTCASDSNILVPLTAAADSSSLEAAETAEAVEVVKGAQLYFSTGQRLSEEAVECLLVG